MTVSIRPERPTDAIDIRGLTIAAFRNAPHTDHNEHFIVDALRESGQLVLSLVAETPDQLVGHVAVSPVGISDGSEGWFGLGPISVLPKYQGQGIGSRLMREALAQLRAADAGGCVLLGDPGYYARFGFSAEPTLRYPGPPPEYFQAIRFRGELPCGTVTYHVSFEARS